jgi:hypothetical protein
MIVIHFPSGEQISIPGANTFITKEGLRVEFSPNDIVGQRAMKLSRNEKFEALKKWIPQAWKDCGQDYEKLAQKARDDEFYGPQTGDMQLLWTVMESLKIDRRRGIKRELNHSVGK